MISYSYACRKCPHTHELTHSVKENPTVLCPACGSDDTYRELQEVTFSIRGIGVYSPGVSLNRKKPKVKR